MRGARGRALSPGTTMPVPLIKRGDKPAGRLESNLSAGPPFQGAVSGPDKPCRMIPFRKPLEVAGGGRAGIVLVATGQLPKEKIKLNYH
jgi:hypothetical protein